MYSNNVLIEIMVPGPPGPPGEGGGISRNTVIELTDMQDFIASIYLAHDGTPTTNWPNRWEYWFKDVGGEYRRTSFINEYGEIRAIPARHNTVALRLFTKERSTDPVRDAEDDVFQLMDDRDNRNILAAIDGAGRFRAANISKNASGVVTVPEGTTGWENEPDGTLWVEYEL